MTNPAKYPTQRLYAGDTKQWVVEFRDAAGDPIDLTDLTWSCQIRETKLTTVGAQDDPLATVAVTDTEANIGRLVLLLTAAESAKLRAVGPSLRAHWDLEGTNGVQVLTYFYGDIIVRKDVTE